MSSTDKEYLDIDGCGSVGGLESIAGAMFESLPMGVVGFSCDLKILYANKPAMELLASGVGYTFAGPDQYFHRKLFSRLNNKVVLSLLDIFWRLKLAWSRPRQSWTTRIKSVLTGWSSLLINWLTKPR
jgi:hypothetical protein